jgi:hypothetical protein
MKKFIIKIFSLDLLIISLFSFILFYNGCSCKTTIQNKETQIPQKFLVKANAFIINKTGEDFFNKYITADFTQSKHIPPNYLMVYKFIMPEKAFVDAQIRFSLDSLGNVLKGYEIVGIPECSSNPSNCDFVIDELIAKQIASSAGLEKGITVWKVVFAWDANYNKYVWHILNTLSERNGEVGFRGNGMQIIIDPNSGEVLAKNEWKVN